jgi:hypothetical protein
MNNPENLHFNTTFCLQVSRLIKGWIDHNMLMDASFGHCAVPYFFLLPQLSDSSIQFHKLQDEMQAKELGSVII